MFSREGCKKFYKDWAPFLLSKGLEEKGFHATDHCVRDDAVEISTDYEKLRLRPLKGDLYDLRRQMFYLR